MAISDKLNYLIETKSQLKTTINYAGAGLTDETFREYPEKLYDKYLDILKDNGEELFNGLPKVTNSGTNITLNGTANTRMKISLVPSELEQETTTGKNKVNIGTTTFEVSKTYDNLNIPAGTYTLSALITSSDTDVSVSRAYLYNGSTSLGNFQLSRNTRSFATITVEQPITQIVLYASNSYNNSVGDTATYKDVQLEEGSTATPYEPYTGGIASPNPDYPQDIHTISGDNTINVEGKNLLSVPLEQPRSNILTCDIPNFKAGTYTFSFSANENAAQLTARKIVGGTTTQLTPKYNTKVLTFTLDEDATLQLEIYRVGIAPSDVSQVMLNKGSTALPYVPYQTPQEADIDLGDIEYCKIGDYEDEFVIPSGSNLFDLYNQTIKQDYAKDNSGNEIYSLGGNYTTTYTLVEPNTIYTFSYNVSSSVVRIYFYDKSKNWISRTDNIVNSNNYYTFTTPNNCYYLQFQNVVNFTTGNIELNKGSTALPYEPYNNGKWYLKKNVGKVVLDGTETFVDQAQSQNNIFYTAMQVSNMKYTTQNLLSNYFKKGNNPKNNNGTIGALYQNYLYFGINTSIIGANDSDSVAIKTTAFKTWLGTHNTNVYYPLATPEYTLLNDTLQEELTNIYNKALSYQDQTNISQENDDLPFVISASAIAKYDLNEPE